MHFKHYYMFWIQWNQCWVVNILHFQTVYSSSLSVILSSDQLFLLSCRASSLRLPRQKAPIASYRLTCIKMLNQVWWKVLVKTQKAAWRALHCQIDYLLSVLSLNIQSIRVHNLSAMSLKEYIMNLKSCTDVHE